MRTRLIVAIVLVLALAAGLAVARLASADLPPRDYVYYLPQVYHEHSCEPFCYHVPHPWGK